MRPDEHIAALRGPQGHSIPMAIEDMPPPVGAISEPHASVEQEEVSSAGESGETVARLETLRGGRLVLTPGRVSFEGEGDAWATAFLPQIAAVRVSTGRKDRGTLLWGIAGVIAALGVWQVATNDAVSIVGGLVVGAIALVLLGEFFFRPANLKLEIILGAETLSAAVARARADEARRFGVQILEARDAAAPPVHSPNGAVPPVRTPRFPLP